MGSTPLWFKCPVYTRTWWSYRNSPSMLEYLRERHQVVRTGRTKPNPSRRRTERTLAVMHEFECSCGRAGWSRIVGILDWPLKADTAAPNDVGGPVYGSPLDHGEGV